MVVADRPEMTAGLAERLACRWKSAPNDRPLVPAGQALPFGCIQQFTASPEGDLAALRLFEQIFVRVPVDDPHARPLIAARACEFRTGHVSLDNEFGSNFRKPL